MHSYFNLIIEVSHLFVNFVLTWILKTFRLFITCNMSEIPYWNIIDKILFVIISVHLFQSSKYQNFQILWFPYSNTYIDIRRECTKGILRMMIITTMIIMIITVFRGIFMFVPCQEKCLKIAFFVPLYKLSKMPLTKKIVWWPRRDKPQAGRLILKCS